MLSNFHLVERIPIESVDKENELLRGQNRYSKLFSSYPPQADVSDILQNIYLINKNRFILID